MMKKKKHRQQLRRFLREEGIYEEVTAAATKRALVSLKGTASALPNKSSSKT
jgi:hypothetical protein